MATNEQVATFYDAAYERLLGEVSAKDDLIVRLADALDVKASIMLAVITFIATQTAYFLDKHPLGAAHVLLIFSGAFLAVATAFAFVELWPRQCLLPSPESSGIERASELRDFYAKHEAVSAETMLAEFTKNQLGWAQQRIIKNQKINRIKSGWLEWSFYFVASAMVLNIAVLLMRFS